MKHTRSPWRTNWIRCGLTALAILTVAGGRSYAGTPEDFYKGKSLSLLIGYSVGGGYDLYGRVVGRHIGAHIPGRPSIVPQNMTGAGSLRAASFIYSAAPKDGTVFGTFSRSMAVAPLLGQASFDGTKFTWLGSVTNDVTLCVASAKSPIKTWNDLMTHQLVVGGEGPGADPDIFALLYKNILGAKFKLVSGYHGTNNIVLAMERGEVDGLCGMSWSTVKSRHPDWIKEKKVNFLIQAGLKKEPDLPNVPMAADLVKTPEQKQILKLFLASEAMARPFAAPPGLPADRRAALITAFDQTMKDPAFLVEANKLKIDVNPISGSEIEDLLKDLYATPKAVLQRAANAIKN